LKEMGNLALNKFEEKEQNYRFKVGNDDIEISCEKGRYEVKISTFTKQKILDLLKYVIFELYESEPLFIEIKK